MARPKAPEGREHAKDAARAHTDLTIFHAVIAILEGGTIGPASSTDARRIIAHCRNAADPCLRRYDAALSKLPKQHKPD